MPIGAGLTGVSPSHGSEEPGNNVFTTREQWPLAICRLVRSKNASSAALMGRAAGKAYVGPPLKPLLPRGRLPLRAEDERTITL